MNNYCEYPSLLEIFLLIWIYLYSPMKSGKKDKILVGGFDPLYFQTVLNAPVKKKLGPLSKLKAKFGSWWDQFGIKLTYFTKSSLSLRFCQEQTRLWRLLANPKAGKLHKNYSATEFWAAFRTLTKCITVLRTTLIHSLTCLCAPLHWSSWGQLTFSPFIRYWVLSFKWFVPWWPI